MSEIDEVLEFWFPAGLARFGRHPHRNAVLGRVSTPEEQAYIDEGDFPHERSANT